MESLNAVFIDKGLPQSERLQELNRIAIQQMSILEGIENKKAAVFANKTTRQFGRKNRLSDECGNPDL